MPAIEDAPQFQTLPASNRRRLARDTARLSSWLAALPDDERARGWHFARAILDGTRLSPARATAVMLAAGWTRMQRRVGPEYRGGLPAVVWCPPGSPVTRRRPGRPDADDVDPVAASLHLIEKEPTHA